MTVRQIVLKPGAIVMWKSYTPVKKLWNKIRHGRLLYNKFTIIKRKVEWLYEDSLKQIDIYEPIKPYSTAEATKLNIVSPADNMYRDWNDIICVVNLVRPKTISPCEDISNNKYYKKLNWDERSDEYIYGAE